MNFSDDVLFIGQGASAPCWYRIMLPALELGCDYVGLVGEPPGLMYRTGIVKGKSQKPNPLDYKVVVIQQPYGKGWLKVIRELQSAGIKVVFEVDDWLHAIQNQKDHDFRQDFDRAALSDFEMCMKACDAMIVSTDFLGRTYRAFNKNVYVCENGVDVSRYDLKMPIRRSLHIGWAGATGHRNALVPWLKVVARLMRKYDHLNVVTIGADYANAFHEQFALDRAIAVPFAAVEQYPAAMTLMDIAIAPAAHTGFYRGKSDLRWLEAGALGIPIVAHPLVYPKIRDGVDGLWAGTPQRVEEQLEKLINDEGLRRTIGENARRYVEQHRSMPVVAQRWREVIERIAVA